MKKLLIILLVLCSFVSYSQIKPLISVELGTKSRSTLIYLPENDFIRLSYPDYSFYSDICIGLNYKRFNVTSNVITNFNYNDGYTFTPFLSEYYIDIFYSHKAIKFGYQHLCTHPVFNDEDVFLINDSFDKLYIKFNLMGF